MLPNPAGSNSPLPPGSYLCLPHLPNFIPVQVSYRVCCLTPIGSALIVAFCLCHRDENWGSTLSASPVTVPPSIFLTVIWLVPQSMHRCVFSHRAAKNQSIPRLTQSGNRQLGLEVLLLFFGDNDCKVHRHSLPQFAPLELEHYTTSRWLAARTILTTVL